MARHFVPYGEARIGFTLRQQPRLKARVAIHVMPDGAVVVDAPEGSELRAIKQAVRQRAAWVWRQLQAQRERQRQVLPRDYVSGETHFYLGRRYPLKVLVTQRAEPGVRLWRGRLEVTASRPDAATVRDQLEAWYRHRAKTVFAQVLADMATRLRLPSPGPAWRLLAMRTQWGSCSPKGDLLLNPGLIKAPKACIEYVLAHELCHLKEHNHSERFYRLLGTALPDWERRKQELDGLAELVLNR